MPPMKTHRLNILCLLLLWLAIGTSARAQIAIVANDSAAVSDVSMNDLKRLYLGSLSTFGGQQITLIEYTPAAETFYKSTVNMTILKFRQHWLKMVFSGRTATPPTAFSDPTEINQALSKKPGSICFLPLDKVVKGMKILTVDHKMPTDSGYAIQTPSKRD